MTFLTMLLSSCKSSCPLPSCQVRTEHHHALNFKNTKSYKKEQEKEAKRLEKELQSLAKAHDDSLALAEEKRVQLENMDAEHDADLQKVKINEVSSVEEGVEVDTEQPKKKKKKKKNSDDDTNEEVNNELASTGKAAKIELKAADKESKELQKESDRISKKEDSESRQAGAVYKSRMLPWWKKNQSPKVGQDYELPEKEEKGNKTEYTW
jgi:hypothetical protein